MRLRYRPCGGECGVAGPGGVGCGEVAILDYDVEVIEREAFREFEYRFSR